ncbi:hypothetical protein BJ546DRAFT_1067525 [Cryomyces antarcticus]
MENRLAMARSLRSKQYAFVMALSSSLAWKLLTQGPELQELTRKPRAGAGAGAGAGPVLSFRPNKPSMAFEMFVKTIKEKHRLQPSNQKQPRAVGVWCKTYLHWSAQALLLIMQQRALRTRSVEKAGSTFTFIQHPQPMLEDGVEARIAVVETGAAALPTAVVTAPAIIAVARHLPHDATDATAPTPLQPPIIVLSPSRHNHRHRDRRSAPVVTCDHYSPPRPSSSRDPVFGLHGVIQNYEMAKKLEAVQKENEKLRCQLDMAL